MTRTGVGSSYELTLSNPRCSLLVEELRMPDLDEVERKLKPPWRSAYDLSKGGHDPEEVASQVVKVLAQLMREEGGIPELVDCARLVHEHEAGLIDDRSLDAAVWRLEHRAIQDNGKLLARAILRPSVSGAVGLLQGLPDERLAEQFLLGKMERELFTVQRGYLTHERERFSSLQEAIEFETKVRELARPGLRELARRLVRDPKAERLRAPRSRRKRKSTREILDEPL